MTATVISLPVRRDRPLPKEIGDPASDRALRAELRRARIRIAQLEASLAEALRDNILHYERARQAEAKLSELKQMRRSTKAD